MGANPNILLPQLATGAHGITIPVVCPITPGAGKSLKSLHQRGRNSENRVVPTKPLASKPLSLKACGPCFYATPFAEGRQGAPLLGIVENRRVSSSRTVQRHVLYLGEINDAQGSMLPDDRCVRRRWPASQTDRAVSRRSASTGACCDVVHVRLSGLRLHRPRQWGTCWLACHVWDPAAAG